MAQIMEQIEIMPVISNNLLGIQQHVDIAKMENFETIPLADESTRGSLKNFATKMKLRFVSSQSLRSHIQILQKFQSG